MIEKKCIFDLDVDQQWNLMLKLDGLSTFHWTSETSQFINYHFAELASIKSVIEMEVLEVSRFNNLESLSMRKFSQAPAVFNSKYQSSAPPFSWQTELIRALPNWAG